MLFTLSICTTLILLILLAFYHRERILPHLPPRLIALLPSAPSRLAAYVPLSTFEDQRNAGFSSSAFDLEANISGGDSRAGLDETAVAEIRQIMQRQRVNFDQARLIRHNAYLAQNGIDPSGMPLDSKAVTRL